MRRLLKPVSAVLATVAGGALVYGLEVHVWGDDIPLWVYLAVAASCGTLSWWLFHVAEHGRWGRKRQIPPKWYEALASELGPLAKNLEAETAEDAPTHLCAENRLGLQRIARTLDEHEIERPHNINPRQGDTSLWSSFLWSLALRIDAGEIDRLPTTAHDMREAMRERAEAHARFTKKLFGEVEHDPKNS